MTRVLSSSMCFLPMWSNNRTPWPSSTGGEVDLQLVEQPGLDGLLDGVCTARDPDVLVACGGPCLLDGAPDAVGDERVNASFGDGVGRLVGDDEQRETGPAPVGPSAPQNRTESS